MRESGTPGLVGVGVLRQAVSTVGATFDGAVGVLGTVEGVA
jgi:hypothetical protein